MTDPTKWGDILVQCKKLKHNYNQQLQAVCDLEKYVLNEIEKHWEIRESIYDRGARLKALDRHLRRAQVFRGLK